MEKLIYTKYRGCRHTAIDMKNPESHLQQLTKVGQHVAADKINTETSILTHTFGLETTQQSTCFAEPNTLKRTNNKGSPMYEGVC